MTEIFLQDSRLGNRKIVGVIDEKFRVFRVTDRLSNRDYLGYVESNGMVWSQTSFTGNRIYCGFIDNDGFIYRQESRHGNKTIIGFAEDNGRIFKCNSRVGNRVYIGYADGDYRMAGAALLLLIVDKEAGLYEIKEDGKKVSADGNDYSINKKSDIGLGLISGSGGVVERVGIGGGSCASDGFISGFLALPLTILIFAGLFYMIICFLLEIWGRNDKEWYSGIKDPESTFETSDNGERVPLNNGNIVEILEPLGGEKSVDVIIPDSHNDVEVTLLNNEKEVEVTNISGGQNSVEYIPLGGRKDVSIIQNPPQKEVEIITP